MKKVFLSALVVMSALFFAACGGDDTDPAPADNSNEPVPVNAKVGFFNGSEGIQRGSFSVSTGFASQLRPGQASNQVDVVEGTHTVIVKNSDNDTEVYNEEINFASGKAYDFFLSGKSDNPGVSMLEQNFSIPDESKVYVQFVNLIEYPNAHKLGLQRKDVGGFALQDIGTAINFRQNSNYVTLLAGSYETDIVDGAGGPKPDQDPITETLVAGQVYQVVAYDEGNRIKFTFKSASGF